jgi:hypothetical protein
MGLLNIGLISGATIYIVCVRRTGYKNKLRSFFTGDAQIDMQRAESIITERLK